MYLLTVFFTSGSSLSGRQILSKPGQSKLELSHKTYSVLSSAFTRMLQNFLNRCSLFPL
jgi:hypothetical protein